MSRARFPLPRSSTGLLLGVLLAALVFPSVQAVDRALVPLEDESWALRLYQAIVNVESGRLRQGIETFHEAFTAADRKRLIRVPPRRPRELASLKDLLKEAGDPVTAEEAAERRGGRRFLPVPEVAHVAVSLLYKEVPEVLLRYRELYDGYAARMLEQYAEHGGLEQLEAAVEQYFFTTRGVWAAELLGDLRFEAGLARRAVGWWRRVLRVTSDSTARTRLRLKVLRALRLLDAPQEYAVEKRRVLALARPAERVALERAVSSIEQAEVMRLDETIPRSRWGGEIPETSPSLAGLRYERSWWSPRWKLRGLPPVAYRQERLFFGVRHLPFIPLCDGDDIYMSWVFELFRIDGMPDHGRVEFEHRKPSSAQLRGLAGDPPGYIERSDSALFTTTLWEKPPPESAQRDVFTEFPERVLIAQYVSDRVLPSDYMQYDITVEIPIRSIVAYDRDGAAPLWKTGRPNVRPTRYAAAVQKDFSYTSPVVVKDGRVVAGGWIQRGFVDSLLRAHDLRTGELLWETFLSGDQNEATMFGEMAREPYAGAILEQDNIIYYLTQFGAVAALDLEDGNVRWLTTYDTIAVHATRSRQALKREAYWDANPLLLIDHVLIVTPRDSEYLLAIDTGSGPDGEVRRGQVLWRYHNADGVIRTLLGYRDGFLYFTGPEGVGLLEVRGLPGFGGGVDPVATELALRYQSFKPTRQLGPGALTAEGVVFADRRGLRLFTPRLGPRPDGTPLQEGELPGDLRTLVGFDQEDSGLEPGRVHVHGDLILRTAGRVLIAYAPDGSAPAR